MSDAVQPSLGDMLENGWSIVGYSVCLMAMGATSHHILLQKAGEVTTLTIVMNGGQEQAREAVPFWPAMQKKKGWFG